MSVFVDDMRAKFGRLVMCHMLADSDEELHAMADAIGVARRWWQAPPHASHYDICLTKRAQAVQQGAIEITQREAAYMSRNMRKTGVLGSHLEARAFFAKRAEEFERRRKAAAPVQGGLFDADEPRVTRVVTTTPSHPNAFVQVPIGTVIEVRWPKL